MSTSGHESLLPWLYRRLTARSGTAHTGSTWPLSFHVTSWHGNPPAHVQKFMSGVTANKVAVKATQQCISLPPDQGSGAYSDDAGSNPPGCHSPDARCAWKEAGKRPEFLSRLRVAETKQEGRQVQKLRKPRPNVLHSATPTSSEPGSGSGTIVA